MKKIYLKPPSNRLDQILFSISLAGIISGKPTNKEKIVQILKKEEIEIDEKVKNKLMKNFQIKI